MAGENDGTAATGNEEQQNPLAMSDDDILNMVPPGSPPAEQAEAEPEAPAAQQQEPAAEAAKEPEKAPEEPAPASDKPVEGKVEDQDPSKKDGEADPSKAPKVDEAGKEKPAEDKTKDEAPDYKAFFDKVMTPFKANGKTIQLNDPSEAIQLMQMGANYTRKMQELVPHRKTLAMLQNNNIDESRLSFLIDLDKRDPEAIKKLLKDSGIDPMELDTTSEPAYREGSHQVTDEEVNFRSALDDLRSTPEGVSTLQIINSQWDQASKDVLWKSPETMALIHEQREAGFYDRIVAEVERQTILGTIPAGTPFLQAYKIAGDQLTAAGAFKDLVEKHSGNAAEGNSEPSGQAAIEKKPEPVATRAATPKPAVDNDSAASAASPTRSTPNVAQPFVNPLSMSDDEFMNKFSGRL